MRPTPTGLLYYTVLPYMGLCQVDTSYLPFFFRYLAYNLLQYIPESIYSNQNLRVIQTLTLNNNKLTVIPSAAFSEHNQLTSITLSVSTTVSLRYVVIFMSIRCVSGTVILEQLDCDYWERSISNFHSVHLLRKQSDTILSALHFHESRESILFEFVQ